MRGAFQSRAALFGRAPMHGACHSRAALFGGALMHGARAFPCRARCVIKCGATWSQHARSFAEL
eukprot:12860269-Alexandrium_andersonii.AAC.1